MFGISKIDEGNFLIRGVNLKGQEYLGYYGMIVKMPNKVSLRLGFDQSTSQTGLCVKTVNNKFIAMFDFVNVGNRIDKHTFSEMIALTLTEMFKDSTVDLIAIEKPFQGKGKYSYETLLMLKGVIRSLAVRVKGFNNAKVEEILPASWRSEFLKDARYKGRKKDKVLVKLAAQEEVELRYPVTKEYLRKFSTPADSCDAVGVLDGYIAKNYVGDGTSRNVNKTMDINWRTEYQSQIVIVNVNDIQGSIFRSEMDYMIYERGYEVMKYNTALSMKENSLRAVCNYNEVCVMLLADVEFNTVFMWETGKMLGAGEAYAVLAVRSTESTSLKRGNKNGQGAKEFVRKRFGLSK